MAAFLDACRFTPTLGGTTDWTLSAAVVGYNSPALAGVVNGMLYKYRAESADLSQWEIGEGAYNTGTNVLARTTVLFNSSGSGTAAGQSGAGTKITFATAPQVAVAAIKEDLLSIQEANSFSAAQKVQAQTNIGVREVLTAARTYFVLATGSDSNTGLVNTAGGAFLTLQKAINTVFMLDINTNAVTIQAGTSTYAGCIVNGKFLGSGIVTLQGDTTTPSNCVISSSTADCVLVENGGALNILGFKITTTGSGKSGLAAYAGGNITVTGKMEYGAVVTAQMRASLGASVTTDGTTATISGGAAFHILSSTGGTVSCQTCTVTVSGTPAFGSAFCLCTAAAAVFCDGSTYTGAATGIRFSASNGGVISVAGGGLNFFPGSVAGSPTTALAGGYG